MHFLTFPRGSRSISPPLLGDITFYPPERRVVSKIFQNSCPGWAYAEHRAVKPSSQLKVAAYFPVNQVDTRTNCGAAWGAGGIFCSRSIARSLVMQLKRRRHSLASRDCRRQVGGGNARKQWAKRRWSWELKRRKRAAECQAAPPPDWLQL